MKTTPLFPDGSNFDSYVPGRITSDGFSTEYNAYTYSYNMHEVTVTASRYTWAEQWCREYTWNRRGQYSSEYSGGEVYISPTTSSGGGGGGGMGMAPNNQWGNSKLTPSVVNYPTATVSTLLGASSYSYLNSNESLTDLGKSLTKAQKAKLAAKYPKELSKGASAAKYGRVVAKGMKKTGNALGYVGVGLEFAEVFLSGDVYASNVYNIAIGILCVATGPVGLVIGGAALIGDIVSYSYTGRTIGGNIDNLFDDRSYKLWDGVY